MDLDFVASAAAFLITVMVLSYLIGDNPLFRIAVHLLVGVAAGYVAAVACWQVLLPDLIMPLVAGPVGGRALLAVPLLLSGMLLMKAWPPLSRLGTPALGMLAGVAAALAMGGAIRGTLLAQVSTTIDSFDPVGAGPVEGIINGAFVLAGVATSLIYFQFSAGLRSNGAVGRLGVIEFLASIGAVFIAVTLGVLFAGVYSAALTALIERLHFLASFIGLG